MSVVIRPAIQKAAKKMNATTPIEKQKLTFKNESGEQLAALLEKPSTAPKAYALFAHCFTCSKDIAAAS
ncbi:MAG TPA: hypothetical protein VIT83_05585, partial [Gammaproteobacteria bacterium]